jgi:hypothetical protein
MPARGKRVFNPNSGGIMIPPLVQEDVQKRIRKVAEEQFAGQFIRLEITFRDQFCTIDAYAEPVLTKDWPPADGSETREEYAERLRTAPIHLCRLRYFGEDRWGFAFFAYNSEKYELSVFSDGEFVGQPEDAFITSASVNLTE